MEQPNIMQVTPKELSKFKCISAYVINGAQPRVKCTYVFTPQLIQEAMMQPTTKKE